MNKLIECVDHVQLPVNSIKEAVNWYNKILGLEIITVYDHAAWLKFSSGPVLMLHYSTKNMQTLWLSEDEYPMPSFMFLTKQIELLHNELQKNEVYIRQYEDHGLGWVIKFVDPFGNELGAYQPKNKD
jgi:methylmalonyl-CoA/ethylmalonyl-CoA epimerase